MSRHLILDTVAAIGFLNGNAALLAFGQAEDEISLPIIAVGELYAGAENSGRVAQNIERVREFIAKRQVIFCDLETTQVYGRVIAQLRKKGRPIPQNDAWIAALALQHSLTLLTRDAHFQQVDGLSLQNW